MTKRIFPLLLLGIVLVPTIAGCTLIPIQSDTENGGKRVPLIVFAAGSLIIPFQELEKAFEIRYPYIDVQAEYHGSIQVIRHATELHESLDVIATADASLIPMLMYAVNDPDSGNPFTNWYIRFATNHLAVAYRPDSLYAGEIDSENWYSILNRPDVKVGIPDPRFDAAGYRSLMAFALAQNYYQDPTIFVDMFTGNFTYPLGIFPEDTLITITVPEILETITDSNIVIRGGSIALIALLESGDLDYAFEYESVIHQHNLKFIRLPGSINMGETEYEQIYNTVEVDLDFQRFVSVEPVFRGERIGYGITIPVNAPHPDEAALFISFLLGPEGRSIMQTNNHPLFDQPICDGWDNIPPQLQGICTKVKLP